MPTGEPSTSGNIRDSRHPSCMPLTPAVRRRLDQVHEPTGWHAPSNECYSVAGAAGATSHEQDNGPGTGIHLFSNAQRFTMQNVNFNTTIHSPLTSDSVLKLLLANSAPSATYNSKDRSFDTPKCDEDTRVGLVEEVMNWAESDEVPSKLLCMTGSAGSGKSALAQTISKTCFKKGCLGASFFFSVSDSYRNNPDYFVGSLAYQISQSVEGVKPHILNVVENDPAIFKMALETQAEALLVNPILKATQNSRSEQPRSVVIVVDGLDECRGEQHQAQVLRALHTCVNKDLPLRILVTSRPEYAIRSALSPAGHLSRVYHIVLNDHDATEDIRLYLGRRLREIGRAKGHGQWPPEDVLEILVRRASGQFIYAATVVKFVGDRRRSPCRLLQIVMDGISNPRTKQSQNPFAALDTLYTNILSIAQAAYHESFEGEEECPRLIERLSSFILINDLHIIERRGFANTEAVEHLLWDGLDECDRLVEDLIPSFR